MIKVVYELQIGDDYMHLTSPIGGVWEMKYPDEADISAARDMIEKLGGKIV